MRASSHQGQVQGAQLLLLKKKIAKRRVRAASHKGQVQGACFQVTIFFSKITTGAAAHQEQVRTVNITNMLLLVEEKKIYEK